MKELDPRIRIRAPLRCDGIGRLDCAEDTVSGNRLAVRWLPLDANGEAAVRACEKLPVHPTLPRILQTGHVGTSAFVALDFPNGELLSASDERLDNEKLLRIASQLSDALATVHSQGVVHGEMSRDSVLLAQDGRAYLWDMPLVIANRLSDRRGENRLMQNLVKTAPFLSPERARGDGASQAGDVYALGAILCVAGGAPLPVASTTLGVVHLVASREWSPRVPSTLPEQWREMLTRMVSTDAAARPTAADVALAFARVPGQNLLPTVPEMPAVRLPPEILQAAEALMKAQAEAMRAPTREVPVLQGPTREEKAAAARAEMEALLAADDAAKQAAADAAVVADASKAALPVASDPLPELKLDSAKDAAKNAAPAALDDATHEAPQADADAALAAEAADRNHEVVRIPTIEIKAILDADARAAAPVPVVEHTVATPAPAVGAVSTSVSLHENVSVAPELVADGAMALSAEEVAALQLSSRRAWMVFGGIAGAALALIAAIVVLAHQKNDVVVTPAPVVAPKVVPAPAPVVKAEPLDELTPLPRLPKAAARPALAPRPVVAAPAPVAAPVEETKPVEAPKPPDFSFLEAEGPKNELKRPSTEL
ncbi:MAG: protein kinase [Myxococcaceae bacterium]